MREVNRKLRVIALVVGLLSIPACDICTNKGAGKTAPCHSTGLIKTELFFGLSKPDGTIITESEWEQFVNEYITPRFKEGLTIINANGRWMGEKGELVKEGTKIVILLHSDSEDTKASIEYIRDKYKKLFGQESVVKVTSCPDVAF